jgi:broad specificity phosphatase PhoE
MKIYLARHGETDWNAEKRLQGWTDIALNEKGRAQARALGKILSSIRLDAIYCSSLKRSIETATMLNREPLVPVSDLNEQSLGSFEGVTLTEEQLIEFQNQRKDPEFRPEGGESRTDHLQRVRRALQRIRMAHPEEDAQILVIAHGGTNNLILQELVKIQTDLTFRIPNHEIFLIDLPSGGHPTIWKHFQIA